MLDLHLYQFTYTTDSNQPYYLGITFNNTEVVVSLIEAGRDNPAAFEVTDKFNGKQLAFVRIDHTDMVVQWHNTVTKAHHLALQLHAEALAQAARDKTWTELLNKAMTRFENIDQYLAKSSELIDSRNVTQADIEYMVEVVESLSNAGNKLDLIADPD